jgi:hypothetical protein
MLEELTLVLVKVKNVKALEEDSINSELYKYAPKDFKLKLLQFLNEVYVT